MITKPQDAVIKLNELGFPPVFEQIQLGTSSEFLQDNCAPPRKFYRFGINSEFPHWLPLWEFDGEELFVFDSQDRVYLRFEYSARKRTVIAHNYQQLITFFFVELILAGLEEEIAELSDAFQYKHLPAFLKVVAIPKGDDWREIYDTFLKSIED